jgi:hypothetical protein
LKSDAELVAAKGKTERVPSGGLPWIKAGRYWVAYRTDQAPAIIAVFFETTNIPGRL